MWVWDILHVSSHVDSWEVQGEADGESIWHAASDEAGSDSIDPGEEVTG